MSNSKLQHLARRLEGEMVGLSSGRSATAGLETERAGDQVDEAHRREQANLAATTLNASFERRRQVQAALGRIRDGRYGECEECGGSIGLKRLEAAPWAELCLSCQEALESDAVVV